MGRPVTYSHADVSRLLAKGLRAVDVAAALGCHRDTVYRIFKAAKGDADLPRRREFDAGGALALYMWGMPTRDIAREIGCSASAVYDLIAEAREKDLFRNPEKAWGGGLTPWFPPGPFVPGMACTHPPFPLGSPFVCLNCHASALDWHPALKASPPPADARPPEPKGGRRKAPRPGQVVPEADRAILAMATAKLTRKERRRLAFASREAERARAVLAKVA